MTEILTQLNTFLIDFWGRYGALIVVVAGVAALLLVVIGAIQIKKKGKAGSFLVVTSFATSLGINAEGMWVVATEKLDLPGVFAIGVFFVFEAMMLSAMHQAKLQYVRTSVRDAEGRLLKGGDPGKAVNTVIVIAFLSGLIVTFNAKNPVEAVLRLTLPLLVVLLWWTNLTAEGSSRRAGKFAYSPRRLMEGWGWIVAEDNADFIALEAERARKRDAKRIRLMVTFGHRLRLGTRPKLYNRWRLTRLLRLAPEADVTTALKQIERTQQMVDLLALRGDTAPPAPVKATIAPPAEPVDALVAAPVDAPVSTPVDAPVSAPPVRRPQRVSIQRGVLTAESARKLTTVPVQLTSDAPSQSEDETNRTDASDPAESPVEFPSTDDGLIALLKAEASRRGGVLGVREAQRVLTPPNSPTECGAYKAKRLMTRAGIRWNSRSNGTSIDSPTESDDFLGEREADRPAEVAPASA